MAEKIDFSTVKFLIVDSNPLSTELLYDILRMLGSISIRRANDTNKALKILRNDDIDVMITEWNVSPLNGLELIDEIRNSLQSPDRMLPIIMLTANSEPEFVVQARDHGVTEFLAKPFTVDAFYRRLVSVIARPRAFVNAGTYFGPDRRRRQVAHGGPERRDDD
ncbi:MAG: response regulator [Alphaproteobacteria bacterium]|nr:response regulator [Alphaproteobacteria bacterium]MBU0798062.1 response regulator [Alphaproteobacteria bacterium]MBU0888762.1 response regulator [Alphaproteobacteria bacterium]MBU1812519.1 response regulator [Alphaproteobacteria bacterium]